MVDFSITELGLDKNLDLILFSIDVPQFVPFPLNAVLKDLGIIKTQIVEILYKGPEKFEPDLIKIDFLDIFLEHIPNYTRYPIVIKIPIIYKESIIVDLPKISLIPFTPSEPYGNQFSIRLSFECARNR